MIIDKLTEAEWKNSYMKNMYDSAFGEIRKVEIEKCDFVLIAKNSEFKPVGFVTCHEMDSETLYWQFGGASKEIKNTFHVLNHYINFIKWSISRYKRITTRIENTNTAMLKIAIKCGFIIYGIWNFKNTVYLELCYEQGGI